MTAILTAFVLTSFALSLVVVIFGGAYSAFRRSSYFRWSMLLAQLNSLFNPVLYCYKDLKDRLEYSAKDVNEKTCSHAAYREGEDAGIVLVLVVTKLRFNTEHTFRALTTKSLK